MRKKLFLILMLFTIEISYAQCKNLYILIEPTSAMSIEDAGKHILTPSLQNVDNIIGWIAEDTTRPKFRNIFIRVIGYQSTLFKREDIGFMPKKSIIKDIYKKIKEKKEYSISNGLSYFSQDLKESNWKGSETMLLVIGDVNFVKEDENSSHGKYLNFAWLTNDDSPFVRDFLNRDNKIAKETSVIIFTRTQLNLKDEKYREDFLVNLFSKVGMKVYYIGDFYNNFQAHLRDADTFAISIINRIRLGIENNIKIPSLPETNMCQIVGNDTITIKNCGR